MTLSPTVHPGRALSLSRTRQGLPLPSPGFSKTLETRGYRGRISREATQRVGSVPRGLGIRAVAAEESLQLEDISRLDQIRIETCGQAPLADVCAWIATEDDRAELRGRKPLTETTTQLLSRSCLTLRYPRWRTRAGMCPPARARSGRPRRGRPRDPRRGQDAGRTSSSPRDRRRSSLSGAKRQDRNRGCQSILGSGRHMSAPTPTVRP
jgi:hypothetical protein